MSKSTGSRKIEIVNDEFDVVKKLCQIIEISAQDAIRQRDRFYIALSGGSVVNMLSKGLPHIQTIWSKWTILFCDERLVPVEDKESTYGLYKNTLIPVTPLQEHQFIPIDFSLTSKPNENASTVAANYEKQLKECFTKSSLISMSGVEYAVLDCAVLGMGPDGHTCSLFPGATDSLTAKSWVVSVTDSPKPPPCRITLTLPLLNNCRVAIFPITGLSKATTVKSVLDEESDLPASLVKPHNGIVYWILDSNAASQISPQ